MEYVYFSADRLDHWKKVEEFVIHVDADDDDVDESDMESDISDLKDSDDNDEV